MSWATAMYVGGDKDAPLPFQNCVDQSCEHRKGGPSTSNEWLYSFILNCTINIHIEEAQEKLYTVPAIKIFTSSVVQKTSATLSVSTTQQIPTPLCFHVQQFFEGSFSWDILGGWGWDKAGSGLYPNQTAERTCYKAEGVGKPAGFPRAEHCSEESLLKAAPGAAIPSLASQPHSSCSSSERTGSLSESWSALLVLVQSSSSSELTSQAVWNKVISSLNRWATSSAVLLCSCCEMA